MILDDKQIHEIRSLISQSCLIALDYYHNSNYKIEIKPDKSQVTDADKAISEMLISGLQRILPGVPVISEEGDDDINIKIAMKAKTFWLVDPIDGTKGFVDKNGNFTINAGLISDGIPVFGIIAEPLLGEVYYTNSSSEAICVRNGIAEKIAVNKKSKGGINVLISQRHNSKEASDMISELPALSVKHVSSSYKFCMVADGRADFYLHFGRTSTWDIAAGHALVNAAGGKMVDMVGRKMIYTGNTFDNPPFFVMNKLSCGIVTNLGYIQ